MATKTDLGYAGFVLDGPYDAGKLYHRNMVVGANGGSYAYKHNTPAAGIPVTDTSHWQQIAEKGDTGAQGPKGNTGAQGPVGNVMYATFDIDTTTGDLVMTTPAEYTGPTFILNETTGDLEVVVNA